jgi:UDP-glucose 4-epimerase
MKRSGRKDVGSVELVVGSVPKSIESPGECHEVNATGTLNVFEAARERGCGRRGLASSCAIYGNTDLIPTREEALAHPQSPYAVTNLIGGHYMEVFREVCGLATVSLRYFNVYGPRQCADSDYAAVIPKFLEVLEWFGNVV